MKNLIFLSLFIILSFIFYSCDPAEFVEDPIDKGLPALTKKGSDIMGAYVNGEVFRSSVKCTTLGGCDFGMAITDYYLDDQHEVDTVIVTFEGKFLEIPNSSQCQINFYLAKLGVEDIQSFGQYVGMPIYLSDSTHWADISIEGNQNCKKITDGFIVFKKVYTKPETQPSRLAQHLLAGEFEFSFISDSCKTILVEKGRFDFDRINYSGKFFH